MKLTGKSLIAGKWLGGSELGFNAIDPIANIKLPMLFYNATTDLVDLGIKEAHHAFTFYHKLDVSCRAEFLRCIGDNILKLGDQLIEMTHQETGLPKDRIIAERTRTIHQLSIYAEQIESKEYQPVFDSAQPDREPLPKPDMRLGYIPLGVVGVFAASNFPLAYSTAGGDTASALAAGCCVVMKAHSSHPGTSELVAIAISKALEACHLPQGIFSMIQGEHYDLSTHIVKHALIKAVGFTGSERVGMILQRQVHERKEPIPFYGELGSVNPQFILPGKLYEQPKILAQLFVNSLTLGQGQFCTSPGLWVVMNSPETVSQYNLFLDEATALINNGQAGVMLTPDIAKDYQTSVDNFKQLKGVTCLAQGQQGKFKHFCAPVLFGTDADTFVNTHELGCEVFGSCAIVVRCDNFKEMTRIVEYLRGNLSASIHANALDQENVTVLSQQLVHKVGRLIYNQMSTGVEVCAAMNHGGPFPASTNIRSTSVGNEAIKRFQRPICYQNMPKEFLPVLLKKC